MKTSLRAGAIALTSLVLAFLVLFVAQPAMAQAGACAANPSITGRPCAAVMKGTEWLDYRQDGQAVTGPLNFLRAASRAPYLGQIDTLSGVLNNANTSYSMVNIRQASVRRAYVPSFQVEYWNGYVSGSTFAETPSGVSSTIALAIEYPVGAFTRVTWGGASSVVAASNAKVRSDQINVNIPAGATYYLRWFIQNSGSVVLLRDNRNAAGVGGSQIELGTALTDKSMGGTMAAQSGFSVPPFAVLGMTVAPSACLDGDSRVVGFRDTTDTTLDVGVLARSVGRSMGYIDLSTAGDRLDKWTASNSVRLAAHAYCSNAIIEYGSNDFSNGFSAASVQTNMQAAINAITAQASSVGLVNKVFLTTVDPRTTDATNATAAAGESNRTAYNDYLRTTGFAGMAGYFETADVVESARNSGLFKTLNGAQIQQDGIHLNKLGNMLIQQSRVIDTNAMQ